MARTPEDLERDQEQKKQQREKFEKGAKDALLGAAGVVTLGMLIKKLVG